MSERPSPTAALSAFLIAMAGLFFFEGFLYLLKSLGVVMGNAVYLVSITFQGVIFAVPALVYYRRNPSYMPAMRLRRIDPLCAALIILAALVGVLALNWVTVYWTLILRSFGLVTSTGNDAAPRTIQQLWLMVAASAIAPALFEEVLFRGLLLPSMEPLGEKKAILISGAMFAMLHGRIEALPAHLMLGVMLALLVLRTDSLPSAMLYHVVYNAAIMFLAYMSAVSDPASLDALPTLSESVQAIPTVIGLMGVWLLLVYSAMQRGMKKQRDPLPEAEKRPLPKTALALLVASAVLLVLVEVRAVLNMLPGGGT